MNSLKNKFIILYLIILYTFINLSWSRSIDSRIKALKKNNGSNPNNHIRIEANIDDQFYEEFKNETIFTSEKIPVKYWKKEKKQAFKERVENEIDYDVDANVTTDSDNFSFYNQMNSNEQQIYDILYTNSAKLYPDLEIKVVVSNVIDINSFIDELVISAEKIFTILSYENPELWWIGTYQFVLVSSQIVNQYIITFLTVPEGSTFYGNTSNDIMTLNSEINQAKTEIMNEIASYNVTTPYAILRYLHDYFITNIVYTLDESRQHIRTLYGALVENKCVCEGYSEAFQYLAHQYGINCLIARSSTHEWNFAEINDKWYVIDITYDDPIVNGKVTPSGSSDNLRTEYFLSGYNDENDLDHKLIYSGFSDKELVYYPFIEEEPYIPSELEIEEIHSMGLSHPSTSTVLFINRPTYKDNFTNNASSLKSFGLWTIFCHLIIILLTSIMFY